MEVLVASKVPRALVNERVAGEEQPSVRHPERDLVLAVARNFHDTRSQATCRCAQCEWVKRRGGASLLSACHRHVAIDAPANSTSVPSTCTVRQDGACDHMRC